MKRKPTYPRRPVMVVARKGDTEESHMVKNASEEQLAAFKVHLIDAGFHIVKVLDYRKGGK